MPVVCPLCHRREFECDGERILCSGCGYRYGCRGEFADLIIGERFADATNEAMVRSEEASNRDTVANYWAPLLRRLWPDPATSPRILSVGCGIGMDVEALRYHGFDVMGIDSGNRSRWWSERKVRDRLVLANGMKLPFEDDTFDVAFCGCVYPHVGVIGDSNRIAPTFRADRLSLAQEMIRVLKPGGRIFVGSPNRHFPLDLFHGRERGDYVPRLNPPWSEFLLSVGDYRRLFDAAGAPGTRPLAVRGYWGFLGLRKTLKGRLMTLPLRFVFWLVSLPAMAFLRGSFISPWIVVSAEKRARPS